MATPYEDEAISFPVGVASAPPFNWWLSLANRRIGQSTVTRGKQYELDTVRTGEYQATYDNRDGRLSPNNTSSPFSPNVTPYRPVRKRFQYPPTPNMLTPNQASSGEAPVGVNGVDGPIAPGNTVPQLFSAVLNPTVAASGTAFEGTQVMQMSLGASVAPSTAFVWVPGWSVMPGAQHTFSVYVRTPTGTSALSVQATINWVGANGLQFQTVAGSVATLPVASNTWTRITVTAPAPPANAAGGYAAIASTNSPSAAYTFQFDGMQLEYASSATSWAKSGTWYSAFNGWIERWPLKWDHSGLFNKTDAVAVDHFGYLSQHLLKPPLYADILALAPTFFYTFDEGQTAQYAVDLSHNQSPAPVTNTTYGAGSLTFGNNIQSTTPPSATNPAGGGFLGGSSQVVTFNNPNTTGNAVAATYIDLSAIGGPKAGSSGYYTRLIAFRKPTGIPTVAPLVWSWNEATFSGTYGGVNGIGINATNYTTPGYASFYSGALKYDASTVSVCDGDWHLFGVVINPTAGTLQNLFDGNALGVASGLTNLQITPGALGGDSVGVGIVRGQNIALEGYAGDVAFVAELPFALSSAQFSQLWTSFKQAYAGETSAQRYGRILGWAGFQGASNITTGGLTGSMGPASDVTAGGQAAGIYSPTTGTDAQTALQNVVTTENGNHFVAADGSVVFQSRAARYGIFPPVVTFGENESGGEIPYDDVQFDFDMTRLANDAQITQYQTSTVFESFNPASQNQYGTRTLTRTINSQSTAECNDAASYMTYRYGNPDLRLKTLRVHVSAHPPAAWIKLLSLELGSRCRVMRRDLSGTIQWDGFVEQVKWTFDYPTNDVWLDAQLSTASLSAFWQVSAMYTTLQTGVSAGATSLTLAPLNTAANLPISAYMSYSYPVPAGTAPGGGSTNPALTLRLEPGTARQEDVTVTGLTSTGGSGGLNYTSFTATLAAGTTFAHTAGVTVSERLTNPYSAITTTSDPTAFDSNSVLGTSTILSY